MRSTLRVGAAVLVSLSCVACEATKTFGHSAWQAPPPGAVRVLLMPTDIELSYMTAAGLLEPRADWTQAAREYMTTALFEALTERGDRLLEYTAPSDLEQTYLHNQLVKLHGAVGATILLHKVSGLVPLPTAKDRFDWTLGSDARALAEDFDADYALFVFVRDSYTGAGRAAVIAAAAILGTGLSGGHQMGFASLVELEGGDVVWFNHLSDSTGDLRKPAAARETVDDLLRDFPL